MARAGGIKAGRAYVELHADDSQLVRGLKRAQITLSNFGDQMLHVGSRLVAIGGAMGGALLGAARHFTLAGDELEKLSRRTDISVESLSKMKIAAQLSGTSLNDLERSLRRQQRFLGYLERGMASAVDVMDRLGLKTEELFAMDAEGRFEAIAVALSRVEDMGLRSAYAQEIFGRSATALIPLLEDYENVMAQVADFEIPEESANRARDLRDALTLLVEMGKNVVFWIGDAVADALIDNIQKMQAAVKVARDWIRENQDLVRLAGKIAVGLSVVGGGFIAVGLAAKTAAISIGGFLGVMGALKATVLIATKILTGYYLVVVAGKVATIAFGMAWGLLQTALKVGLILLVPVIAAFKGMVVVLGLVTMALGAVKTAAVITYAAIASLAIVTKALIAVGATAAVAITLLATGIGSVVVAIGALMAAGLIGLLGSIVAAVGAVIAAVRELARSFTSYLAGAVRDLGDMVGRLIDSFKRFASKSGRAVSDTFGRLQKALGDSLRMMRRWGAETWSILRLAFEGLQVGAWQKAWELVFAYAKLSAQQFIMWFMSTMPGIIKAVGDIFAVLWERVFDLGERVFSDLYERAQDFAGVVRDEIQAEMSDLLEQVTAIGDAITKWAGALGKAANAVGKIKAPFAAIVGFAKDTPGMFRDAAGELLPFVGPGRPDTYGYEYQREHGTPPDADDLLEVEAEELPEVPEEVEQWVRRYTEYEELPGEPEEQIQVLRRLVEADELPDVPKELKQYLSRLVEYESLPEVPEEVRQYVKRLIAEDRIDDLPEPEQEIIQTIIQRAENDVEQIREENKKAADDTEKSWTDSIGEIVKTWADGMDASGEEVEKLKNELKAEIGDIDSEFGQALASIRNQWGDMPDFDFRGPQRQAMVAFSPFAMGRDPGVQVQERIEKNTKDTNEAVRENTEEQRRQTSAIENLQMGTQIT